mgnify:CR=1 FL=1
MQKKMKNEKIQGVQAENMEREQETKEFLKQFYESPEAEEDTIAAKLKRTFVPKGKKTKAIADFAKDLMGEGGAGDVVIDETEDVQVEVLDRAFYLDDVLDTHFVALGILDDGNGAVKFVEFQVMINSHGFAGLDMVKYETFVKCSNV